MRNHILIAIACFLGGCATIAALSLEDRFGKPDPARYDQSAALAPGAPSYQNEVRPLLARRCVVCHACYDSPCQAKLGSWQGIARGASTLRVYDAARLREAPPTRLFTDALSASQWRQRGFHPILNERSPPADLEGSVLYRSLALKQANPLPPGPVLGREFDFSLDRNQSCPRIEQFGHYERRHPLGGMPYGLPGLAAGEMSLLVRWLQAGAPDDGEPALPPALASEVRHWEAFLNGDSPKQQLMGRYLYEHLFLAHLVFDADPAQRAFTLVRSATPPGEPVRIIATRRPTDDPGVARVYYRIEPERETVVAKTHMPYTLSPGRMAKLRAWFLDASYAVRALPSWEPAVATNPFRAYADIPPDSRYRFLLDEAQFFIMSFMKGPVCRGQVALNVIRDRFWVVFLDPAVGAGQDTTELLARQAGNLDLPAAYGSDAPILRQWLNLARQETRYLEAKSDLYERTATRRTAPDLSFIWDGDGRNPNAALTIFRHFDSASVVRGLAGEPPKTAWVIGYPLLERIYYLLVAGYDVYGNAGHQLSSRLYMDFLRMEGEFNFLVLLPKAAREPLRDRWYRDAPGSVKDYVYGRKATFSQETAIAYRSADPQAELYAMLRTHLAPVLDPSMDPSRTADPALRKGLARLGALRGTALSWLPETVILRIDDAPPEDRHFTLLRDTGHRNVSTLFREERALAPEENAVTVLRGFVGAYPNTLYRLRREDLPALASAIGALASEADYRRLADRFALRRTDPEFWRASDALQDAHAAWAGSAGGLLDYSRWENR